jgi:hypothetical protein
MRWRNTETYALFQDMARYWNKDPGAVGAWLDAHGFRAAEAMAAQLPMDYAAEYGSFDDELVTRLVRLGLARVDFWEVADRLITIYQPCWLPRPLTWPAANQ